MQLSQRTTDFIRLHADDDIRQLALSARKDDDLDLPFALDQIKGRQIARHKLPSWAAVEGIIFPPHISMEQCSSEQTARYKARVAGRFVDKKQCCMVDITGGFGVDFSYLAQGFHRCVYVERQLHLCDIARHNLPLLGIHDAEVVCGDGEEVVKEMQGDGFFLFLDPARRDSHGNRTYAIADCTPDVLSFINLVAEKCEAVMIKLSPMLDWHATVDDINSKVNGHDAVREVHIISTANECKELLIVVSTRSAMPLKVFCVNDDSVWVPSPSQSLGRDVALEHNGSETGKGDVEMRNGDAGDILLVPNASVMKAGCFTVLADTFGVKPISSNSHLFISHGKIADFPGKSYEIIAVSTMNRKELRTALHGIEQANIATRNFPLSPDQLRKRLKLRDGGDTYIFATTTEDKQHVLYVTRRHSLSSSAKEGMTAET